MVSGTAPSIYSLAFDVLLFALLIMMLHTTQRNQSGNKHAKLLLRHLVRNVLSILVEGNHQCAGDGGFHHAGSDSLEKARHALLLPITRLRSGHLEDCLHDAEGGKRLSGSHLLLRLHHVERVHEEGAVAPQMKLLAGRGRSVFFTTERVCSRLRFTCRRERHISQWRAEKEMSRRRFV